MTLHFIKGSLYVFTNPNRLSNSIHTYYNITKFRYLFFGIFNFKIGIITVRKYEIEKLSRRQYIKKYLNIQ
jgi:hypothetical protein